MCVSIHYCCTKSGNVRVSPSVNTHLLFLTAAVAFTLCWYTNFFTCLFLRYFFFLIFCVSIQAFLHATKNAPKNRPKEIQLTSRGTAIESWQRHVRSAAASQRSGHAVRQHVIGFDRHFEKHNAQSGENGLDSENRLHPRKQAIYIYIYFNIYIYIYSSEM